MITIYVENEPSFTFPNNDAGHTQAEALFQVLCSLFDSVGLELPAFPPPTRNAAAGLKTRKASIARAYLSSALTVQELAESLEMPYGRVSKWLRDELGTTDRRFLHQF